MIKRLTRKQVFFLILAFLFLFNPFLVLATSSKLNQTSCFIYFTGVGCPHCAKTDPVVLGKKLATHPELVIIEYEIYQEKANAPLLLQYNNHYNSGLGIPLFIISSQKNIIGDTPILQNIEQVLLNNRGNSCLLLEGPRRFSQVDIDRLPGKPKIWYQDRILIATEEEKTGGKKAKQLLISPQLQSVLQEELKNKGLTLKENISVALSGKKLNFAQGIEVGSWILAWKKKIELISTSSPKEHETTTDSFSQQTSPEETLPKTTPSLENSFSSKPIGSPNSLTWPKLVSLAAVDAINPCALAVLALMLSSIILYNPREKKYILLSGISFVLAVFVLYYFYGIVIIRFFRVAQTLTVFKYWLYKILGGMALLLGILEVKDFLFYKPGGIATEMPLSLRPKVKRLIRKVTSPLSAGLIGVFVTLFLLPCTIGPYVIAGGLLSNLNQQLAVLLRLLVYNLIFVSPMVLIVLGVYWGIHDIKNLNDWREKHIRQLHLVAGIILAILGLVMVLGY